MKRLAIVVLLLLVPTVGTLVVEAQGVTPCPGGQSWDGFDAGAVIQSFEWDDVGVTLDVVPNQATDGPGIIFDSHCSVPGGCTGGDDDLSTTSGCNPTNQAPRDKVLICQDGEISEVGDTRRGCTFLFDFDQPVTLSKFGFLDVEEAGSWVRLTNSHGLAKQCTVPPGPGQCSPPHDTTAGNNSWQGVNCLGTDIVKLEIYLDGSGAITDLCRAAPMPVVLTGFGARGAPGTVVALGAICAIVGLAAAGFLVLRGRTRHKARPPA